MHILYCSTSSSTFSDKEVIDVEFQISDLNALRSISFILLEISSS